MPLPPTPLNPTDHKDFLSNIQGNILTGHGRKHVALLLCRFERGNWEIKPDKLQAAKQWLASFTNTTATSAWAQYEQTEKYRQERDAGHNDYTGELFSMVLLTQEFYRQLGYKRFDDEMVSGLIDNNFWREMAALGELNEDGRREEWDENYRRVHDIMVLLAHDDESQLTSKMNQFRTELGGLSEEVLLEIGHKLSRQFPGQIESQTIEHFGFADGISQPIFYQSDLKKMNQEQNIVWNSVAPLDLVLVKENDLAETYGSYMVYRKLQQHVDLFNEALIQIAQAYGFDPEIVGAMAVGRKKDGTPLILASNNNDFNFENDPAGQQCPWHAHIRKTNPRGELRDDKLTNNQERDFRITRRGITYGRSQEELEQNRPIEGEVGLLFMSFQYTLRNPIEQQEGSDSIYFPRRLGEARPNGVDPIIGRGKSSERSNWARWPSNSNNSFEITRVVTLKGGDYFFAPSRPFLIGLAPLPNIAT